MIPPLENFLLPVLKEIAQANESIQRRDICLNVAEKLGIAAEDKLERTGSDAFLYLVRPNWCISYLSKADYIRVVRRGYYTLTSEGKAILAKNPIQLTLADLMKSPSYADWIRRSNEAAKLRRENGAEGGLAVEITLNDRNENLDLLSQQAPEELLQKALSAIDLQLKSEIQDQLEKLTSTAFEGLCVKLLQAIYNNSTGIKTQKTRDGGIDGIITRDALGLDKVYIQAKKYNTDNKVTPSMVQSFKGALDDHRASAGVMITTSEFTEDAHKSARASTASLSLVDGERLAELMITYNVGCSVRKTYTIKGIDTDFFDELE